MTFCIEFWGVRGTLPVWGTQHDRIGGHTMCIVLKMPSGYRLIFDAGSGIHPLGHEMLEAGQTAASLLFTHFHLDHVMGFPLFEPLWKLGFRLDVYAPKPFEPFLDHVLMADPLFPVTRHLARAAIRYHTFKPGEALSLSEKGFDLDQIQITTFPLLHPGGSVGYRVDTPAGAFVHLTDMEIEMVGGLDPSLVAFAHQAKVLLVDSTYTLQDYPPHRGWGHSTWKTGTTLAKAAQAEKLYLIHHNQAYSDDVLLGIEKEAQKDFPPTLLGREGESIVLR
jgi:phosphoribosyl 1,2-cyclic phosphodiesterase